MDAFPWADTYELDMPSVFAAIRSRGARRVLLQFPDGLRDYSAAVAAAVARETGAETLVAGGACYGACDPSPETAAVGADLLVQFGHSPIPSVTVKDALFVRAKSKLPVDGVVRRAAADLPGRRVGVLTTAQYAHRLEEILAALRAAGKEPLVGRGDLRIAMPAQVLGCNYSAGKAVLAQADCFLYVGSGDFHPLGMALETDKPLVVADPENDTVRTVAGLRERILRQRHAAIARAKDARSFAILVSTKPGQFRMRLALETKALIEKHGRAATIVTLDTFTPDSLQYWRKEGCWVNTACPRIATDDFSKYQVPMVTPPELEMAFGLRRWEEGYVFDAIDGDPTQHETPP
ncbi:MAG TPA: diphthamide biosynthesis enzyme Dph2 [Candidatus Thermoplasmatota archaeon]|nr:diphthamide biosynthesis enzyme Dph2 [Candidatus Thermoplasmatota archaeon]